MSVPELLATHTSYELAEWRAFDLAYGLGDQDLREVLSGIHEQLQMANHLTGAAHFTPENDPDKNPIPPPRRYPRAGDPPRSEEDDEE